MTTDTTTTTITIESLTTIEIAKDHLQSFLQIRDENSLHWLHSSFTGYRDYEHLFQVLKKYPDLATERFDDNDGSGSSSFPLTYLLAAAAAPPPPDMIEEVCKMNPQALMTPNCYDYLPLHSAIRYECCPEVIAILLSHFPEAAARLSKTRANLSIYDHRWPRIGDYWLPIEHLTYKIHEWNNDNNEGGDDYAGESFTKIFQMLYHANPPKKWGYSYSYSGRRWARILFALMWSGRTPPSLLNWLGKTINEEAQDHHQHNHNHDDHQNNNTSVLLQTVSHVLNRGGPQPPDMIRNLQQFVPMLTKCQHLVFEFGHRRIGDGTFLVDFLSKVTIPPKLALSFDGFHVDLRSSSEEDDISDEIMKSWSCCNLESLSITFLSISSVDMERLCQCFQVLPRLKKLKLCKTKTEGTMIACTNPVIQLLQANTRTLEELDIVFFQIDVPALSEALQKLPMSVANVWYRQEMDGIPNLEIAYHSSMNKHGHNKLTCSSRTSTRETLVECLASVQQDIYDHGVGQLPPSLELSLLYGLLHKAPALWAISATATAKREETKREESMFSGLLHKAPTAMRAISSAAAAKREELKRHKKEEEDEDEDDEEFEQWKKKKFTMKDIPDFTFSFADIMGGSSMDSAMLGFSI